MRRADGPAIQAIRMSFQTEASKVALTPERERLSLNESIQKNGIVRTIHAFSNCKLDAAICLRL